MFDLLKDYQNEMIYEHITYFAENIYGDVLEERIKRRIKYEFDELNKCCNFEDIFNAAEFIDKKKCKGELLVSRLAMNNSFIFYLLGLSVVNPLPRHTYCPKCHTLHWGKLDNDICECCGHRLIEDGYDLPFAVLLDDIKRIGLKFDYSSTHEYANNKLHIKFYKNDLVCLAKELGITQSQIESNVFDKEEIIKCLDKDYYSQKYKKRYAFSNTAFMGINDLDSGIFETLHDEFKPQTFDEVTKLICMMHGTGVYDASEENLISNFDHPDLNECICSRDELFQFLKNNQFNDEDAVLMCRETRINGSGHLSEFSENKLTSALVESKYIDFMKSVSYLFHKGHVVGHIRLGFIIAKTYLEDPKRYFEAYFTIHKEMLMRIDENDNFIKKLMETKCLELEIGYALIIDLLERGIDAKQLICTLKARA